MPYDIHFQPVPQDASKGLKVFTFGFTAALKVKGPQALVNRWAKTFMTPLGSDPRDPDAGTEFANMVGGNLSLRSPEVQDVITVSIDETNEQVREQDLEGDYDANESLLNARLIGFKLNDQGDGVEIWVEIVNREEERLTLRLMDLATR